jgi:hypothetical protein
MIGRLRELRLSERVRRKASPNGANVNGNGNGRAAPELPAENTELRKQRDRLLEKFTVMQADLGGAFYEMAIRDHVRLDVLTRKAAELQRVDAGLLAVERLLEIERTDAAGHCPTCNSPFGSADRFCPQCGTSLVATEAAP